MSNPDALKSLSRAFRPASTSQLGEELQIWDLNFRAYFSNLEYDPRPLSPAPDHRLRRPAILEVPLWRQYLYNEVHLLRTLTPLRRRVALHDFTFLRPGLSVEARSDIILVYIVSDIEVKRFDSIFGDTLSS